MSAGAPASGGSGTTPVVACLLTAAMMIAAVAASTWESWRSAVRESHLVTAQIATSLAIHGEEKIERASVLAQTLRRRIADDRSLLEPGNPHLADLIGKLLSAAPPWIGVSVADAEGRLVGASSNADLRGRTVSIAQQPSFRMHVGPGAATGEAVAISPPFRLQTRPLLAFVVSVALRDEAGELVAVALVSVPSNEVLRSLDPIRQGTATHIALAHRDGFLLSAAPDAPDAMPLRPGARWIAALAGRAGTFEELSPFSSRPAIVSLEELQRFPIVAVASRDVAALARHWVRAHAWELAAGILLIVAAIGLNLGLLRAVRARVRAEAQLRESSEGRFRDFAAIATDWFWETDSRHRFTYVSQGPGAEGLPVEAFLGKTRVERAREFQDPVSPLVIELEQKMERREVIRGFVVDSVRPDGGRAWWEISGRPLPDASGRFIGYRGVARDVTALREAQERIAESEARLADSINSMPIGYALWDSRDRLVAWNRRYLELWPSAAELMRPGITFDAFIQKAMRTAWPDLAPADLQARIAERIARHAACDARWIRDFPDGRIIEFSEMRTSEGGIVSLYADVTGHQRALADLAASDARFRDGIERMADGFTLWDADDRLIIWNERFARIAPIEAEVLRQGIRFSECMDHLETALAALAPAWDWRGYVAQRRGRLAALGTSIEVTNVHGSVIEIIEQPTSEGGVVSIYRDVTAARKAARRIADSEARFHDFAEVASDWFWETDADDRFTFVSGGTRRMDVDPEDLIGRTRAEYDAFRGRQLLPSRRGLDEIIARREVIRGFCFEEPSADGGEPRRIEIHGKPIHDEGGRFLGYRGTGRDVTERDRQQAELARALAAEREMNAQQRRFVSIASHEFRTPLAVIDGATQRLMARLGSGDAEAVKRLDRIRGGVARMTELIDRTLSSARLDDGRIEMQLRAIDVATLLREAIDRQGQISPEHRIALRLDAEDTMVEGDPKLLEQVFANLLSNAVKYSGRSRRIEVTLTSASAGPRISFRDHGVGIPPAEVLHLFTRFFRASTAMGIPGTGIGLHLVHELVRMHGGRIDVESEVGVGSTFTVTLPRRQSIAEADAAQ